MTGREIRAFVFDRAMYACEYCKYLLDRAAGLAVVEPIHPRSKDGSEDLSNKAAACAHCNSCKYNLTTALDPTTGESVALFHPRKQVWTDHFEWSDDYLFLIGKTATGRATIAKLDMNHQFTINFRKLAVGRGHPPPNSLG